MSGDSIDRPRPPDVAEPGVDPHDVFLDPAAQGLEPVARAWGVFEFTELRGVYPTRELAEEMLGEFRSRWRALPPTALTPHRYAEDAFRLREVPILDRRQPG